MEISERLHCLFSGQVEENGDTYTIEVPAREVHLGTLDTDRTYRVALLPAHSPSAETQEHRTQHEAESPHGTSAATGDEPTTESEPVPPVDPGEERIVEIESLGDQGDGITRVDRGFVVIVPDTERGERVRIEITDVRETVAFADVVERLSYYS